LDWFGDEKWVIADSIQKLAVLLAEIQDSKPIWSFE
jgi:hypothetical protein